MLSNVRGEKRKEMDIPEQEWIQIQLLTRDGIIRKLDASRKFLDIVVLGLPSLNTLLDSYLAEKVATWAFIKMNKEGLQCSSIHE